MGWRQLALAALVCSVRVRGDGPDNSLTDKASLGLSQCKNDLKLYQLCRVCAARETASLTQCCSDFSVHIQCQSPSRGRRDTSSLDQAQDSIDSLYDTLTNLRVVGRTSGPRAFLGKRAPWFYPTKRLRNNFLGKRDVSDLSPPHPLYDYMRDEHKRSQLEDEVLDDLLDDSFLDDDLEEDKRGRLNFLGKRARLNFLGKRARVNFLGKRARLNFLGKRGRVNFLGKRESPLEEDAFDAVRDWRLPEAKDYLQKRGRLNFLGKRGRLNFLGKRDMRLDLEVDPAEFAGENDSER